MNAKEENVLVKVVKKAVGLPTGNTSCGCSASMPVATACCDGDKPEAAKAGCDCESAAVQEEQPAQE